MCVRVSVWESVCVCVCVLVCMTEGEWVRTKDLAVKMFQVIFKCQFVCMCCQSSFGLQWLECCVCVWENVCVRVCVFCYLDPLLLLSVRSNKTKTLFFLSVYTHIVQLQFNIRLTARAHTHTHTLTIHMTPTYCMCGCGLSYSYSCEDQSHQPHRYILEINVLCFT